MKYKRRSKKTKVMSKKEVKNQEEENLSSVKQNQPNHFAVSIELISATLEYLNTQPRGQVNQIATALERSQPIYIEKNKI